MGKSINTLSVSVFLAAVGGVLVFFFGPQIDAALAFIVLFIDGTPFGLGWTVLKLTWAVLLQIAQRFWLDMEQKDSEVPGMQKAFTAAHAAVTTVTGHTRLWRPPSATMTATEGAREQDKEDDDNEDEEQHAAHTHWARPLLLFGPPFHLMWQLCLLLSPYMCDIVQRLLFWCFVGLCWGHRYISCASEREWPTHWRELPMLLPPYVIAIRLLMLLTSISSSLRFMGVAIFPLMSSLSVYQLHRVTRSERASNKEVKKKIKEQEKERSKKRLLNLGPIHASATARRDDGARSERYSRKPLPAYPVYFVAVLFAVLPASYYYVYTSVCDEHMTYQWADGELQLLCDGDDWFSLDLYQMADDTIDGTSEAIAEKLVVVQTALSPHLPEIWLRHFAHFRTSIALFSSDGRCFLDHARKEHTREVRHCAGVSERPQCEAAFVLWKEQEYKLGRKPDGRGRYCCGGQWFCQDTPANTTGAIKLISTSRSNQTKLKRWFSREANMVDALTKAYKKRRCHFMPPVDEAGRVLMKEEAEANVFSSHNNGRHVRLRDYFAATWHCTGTEVSDLFVPCVFSAGSCTEAWGFTCHTCDHGNDSVALDRSSSSVTSSPTAAASEGAEPEEQKQAASGATVSPASCPQADALSANPQVASQTAAARPEKKDVEMRKVVAGLEEEEAQSRRKVELMVQKLGELAEVAAKQSPIVSPLLKFEALVRKAMDDWHDSQLAVAEAKLRVCQAS